MQGIGPGLRQCPDKEVRVGAQGLKVDDSPGSEVLAFLGGGVPSGWPGIRWSRRSGGQLGYDISSGQRPQRRSPQHQQQQCPGQQLGQGK